MYRVYHLIGSTTGKKIIPREKISKPHTYTGRNIRDTLVWNICLMIVKIDTYTFQFAQYTSVPPLLLNLYRVKFQINEVSLWGSNIWNQYFSYEKIVCFMFFAYTFLQNYLNTCKWYPSARFITLYFYVLFELSFAYIVFLIYFIVTIIQIDDA